MPAQSNSVNSSGGDCFQEGSFYMGPPTAAAVVANNPYITSGTNNSNQMPTAAQSQPEAADIPEQHTQEATAVPVQYHQEAASTEPTNQATASRSMAVIDANTAIKCHLCQKSWPLREMKQHMLGIAYQSGVCYDDHRGVPLRKLRGMPNKLIQCNLCFTFIKRQDMHAHLIGSKERGCCPTTRNNSTVYQQ